MAAKSPSFSHPSMPDSGSDIVPPWAVTGVYLTNATSTAGHPATIAQAAASAATPHHDNGRPRLRRLPDAEAAVTKATATCQ
ncbi:MAG: hypothetical protein ACRDPY_29005 [Streptosporangiaceae bacterium]